MSLTLIALVIINFKKTSIGAWFDLNRFMEVEMSVRFP